MGVGLGYLLSKIDMVSTSDHALVVSINLFVALLCASIVLGHLLEENRWMNESITALLIGLCTGIITTGGTSSHLLIFSVDHFFIYPFHQSISMRAKAPHAPSVNRGQQVHQSQDGLNVVIYPCERLKVVSSDPQMDPFIRIVYEEHHPIFRTNGGLYYLHTSSGGSEVAAVSMNSESGHLIYKAWPPFVDKYIDIYPMGNADHWNQKRDLTAWLKSIMYYSFAFHGDLGIERPWFVKKIEQDSPHELMAVPSGLMCFFRQQPNSFWILLKNGSKVWPIRVVNHSFRDNWSAFLKDHGVKPGYNIVFGCHKQWIFDVIILNKDHDRVERSWNTNGSILYQVHYPAYVTVTSCLPSIMQSWFHAEQFGCIFQSTVQLTKVLEEKMHHHLRDGEMKEVCIRTGNRLWKVPVINGKLGHWSMTNFVETHNLGPSDFLFFGISNDGKIHGLIFARHGGERPYSWF